MDIPNILNLEHELRVPTGFDLTLVMHEYGLYVSQSQLITHWYSFRLLLYQSPFIEMKRLEGLCIRSPSNRTCLASNVHFNYVYTKLAVMDLNRRRFNSRIHSLMTMMHVKLLMTFGYSC